MKNLIIFALVSVWVGPAIHLVRERELCPFACRVDANGVKGAWYEVRLPGFQQTLWVSDAQKALQIGVAR